MSTGYKKQFIYILLGMTLLLFPFFNTVYLVLAFLAAGTFFSTVPSSSRVFSFLAREHEIKSGRLTGLIQLFFTTAALLTVSLVVGNKLPLFIIGAAFAITTFGDGAADIINLLDKARQNRNDTKFYSVRASIVFLISGSISALLAGAWISGFTSYGLLFFLAVIGAIAGALFESITSTEDNIVIPFGSAMVMWLFFTFSFSYDVDTLYLMLVLAFSFLLGYLAYKARIADISAMLSATLLGVVIIISSDKGWFLFSILLAFFFLGSLFTRYRYGYKMALGIAERKKGIRGYKNVFSNSLAALSLAVAYGIFPSHGKILLAAYLGSVATACGDTLASEIGETYRGEPRMITTLRKVRAGTDGAISHIGEGAAFFGASVIALLAFLSIQKDFGLAAAVTAGGFIGVNIDSILGATLQQKGYLSNNGVNLFATISGAIISAILFNGLVV